MLATLAASFQRLGHEVVYPTMGPRIEPGQPILIRGEDEFEEVLASTDADAGIVIAPDEILPGFLELLEENTVNLGCPPQVARISADKLECTKRLEDANVPVVDVVENPKTGEGPYVLKPRFGCDSERTELVATFSGEKDDRIVTRYYEGESLSVSLVGSGDQKLSLTINRQLIRIGREFHYEGSEVPYRSDRDEEILRVAKMAADVLDLRGYVGIDLVVGDIARVVDVNPRPTTSMVGISRVMREELGDLILRAKFSTLPEKVTIEGECIFTRAELEKG